MKPYDMQSWFASSFAGDIVETLITVSKTSPKPLTSTTGKAQQDDRPASDSKDR